MISEQGRILAIEPDAVWVETVRRSTCQSCSLKKGCGHGLMGEALGDRRQQVRVLLGEFRSDQLQLDDEVDIDIPESVLVGGALLVYIVPLITLLLGALCGQSGFAAPGSGADIPAVIGAVVGFALGLVAIRIHSRVYRNRQGFQPVLARVRNRTAGYTPIPS